MTDLHAGYATAKVLAGVTLSVGEGECLALLGRNGMGKTTLLRSIVGLRPPAATRGSITFENRDLLPLASYEIARLGLNLVPQGRRIFGSLNVEENLQIASRSKQGGWDLAGVYELFPRLGERRKQRSGTLSGGEQQMLAIGRALMTNPRLLVMDEPSEGLAPAIHELILARMQVLTDAGQSVLIAEQNVDFALNLADRIAILGEGGVIVWSGTATQLQSDTALLANLVGVGADGHERKEEND